MMYFVLEVLAGAVLSAYLMLMLALMAGWMNVHRRSRPAANPHTNEGGERDGPVQISVLIAARNEGHNVPALIRDLRSQYLRSFEVMIMDDHSDDDTVARAREAIDGDARFRIVSSSGVGKKAALTTGVALSQGSLIVTTDADCRVHPGWLHAMTRAFDDPAIMFVFGGVRMTGRTLFTDMQTIEFAALIGAGAATAGSDIPTMCNGANLSYRKDAFAAVRGYEDNLHIPSGDDEFLMRKINQSFPGSVKYCAAPDAVVDTLPLGDITSFIAQRVRWASKWRRNNDLTTRLLAVFIFTFHVFIATLPAWVLLDLIVVETAVTAIVAKAGAEFVFLWMLRRRLKFRWNGVAFLLWQLVYSYYVVAIALWSQFAAFEWKGRRVKPFTLSMK